MKRTIIAAAMALAFALTGCGSDGATEPVAPAQVIPDSAEQPPPTDPAERPWGGQAFE